MNYNNVIAITNRKICYQSLCNRPESEWHRNTCLTPETLARLTEQISMDEQNACRALLSQMARLSQTNLIQIVLREKDLSKADYMLLAKAAIEICNYYNKKLILHNYIEVTEELKYPHIQLPLHIMKSAKENNYSLTHYQTIGVSVHSTEEAILAEKLGATYLSAGHVFDTECKKGLPGRGLSFLQDICTSVSIPVYAIGGINQNNIPMVMESGARGGCMMSGLMKIRL